MSTPTGDAILVGCTMLGFRVEEVVGRGGMGVVYRAWDARLKRSVAIKLVAPALSEDPLLRERFLRETEAAAALEHPNVVPIHAAGTAGGDLYVVMRFVDGDLRGMLDHDGLPEPELALDLCRQISGALDAAHERGLVHRDVKPSNVLLDEQGHAYVTDFGISARIDASPDSRIGALEGTAGYIAPEQIRGGRLDGRADQYALACVLFECLTGTTPFAGESELDTLLAQLERPPPDPRELRHELPTRLEDVFARALAKDPEERYPSCRSFIEQADAAFAPRRSRWRIGAAAVAVASLAAAAIALLVASDEPSATPPVAGDGTVIVVDPRTMRVEGSLAYGHDLSGLAAAGGSVWVASLGTGKVARIDARTYRVEEELAIAGAGVGPTGIAASGDNVWLVNAGQDELSVYSLSQDRIRWDEPLHRFEATPWTGLPGKREIDLDAVAVGDGLWAASRIPRRVVRFERGAIDTVEVSLSSGRAVSDSRLAAGEGRVFATAGSEVLALDPRTGEVRERRSLRAGVLSDVAAAYGSLWLTDVAGDVLFRLDPRTLAVVARIRVPGAPDAVAAGGGAIWVGSFLTGNLVRIDPTTNRVSGTVAVGGSPDDVAVAGGRVWVTLDP